MVFDAERRGVSGVATVEHGKAHKEIVEYANENDIGCIVRGTHGRDGVQDVVLDNVIERVVRTSNVPVLTIRRGKLE
ncbi:universal stress protein [Halalkalicoccus salilacus]|uniref:universal stress protein n=1 Tax=Halalkalicoccus salilacus TaxID=3117459 RepID=UPI00300F6287